MFSSSHRHAAGTVLAPTEPTGIHLVLTIWPGYVSESGIPSLRFLRAEGSSVVPRKSEPRGCVASLPVWRGMAPSSSTSLPKSAGTESETSTLLTDDNFADERPHSRATTYGTIEDSAEEACQDGDPQHTTPRKYSNAFVARTVLALFIGECGGGSSGSLPLESS